MRLLNRLASLLAIAAMLSFSAWGMGCAGENGTDTGTGTDEAAPGDTGTETSPADDETGTDEPGSTTGGGTDAP